MEIDHMKKSKKYIKFKLLLDYNFNKVSSLTHVVNMKVKFK